MQAYQLSIHWTQTIADTILRYAILFEKHLNLDLTCLVMEKCPQLPLNHSHGQLLSVQTLQYLLDKKKAFVLNFNLYPFLPTSYFTSLCLFLLPHLLLLSAIVFLLHLCQLHFLPNFDRVCLLSLFLLLHFLSQHPHFWIDLLCRISLCLTTIVAHSQLWFSHQQFVALPWWNPATNRIPSYEKNFLYGNYRFGWEGYFYCGNPSISTPFFAETKIAFTSVYENAKLVLLERGRSSANYW